MGTFRNFEEEIKNEKFWDLEVEEKLQTEGFPIFDCILQNRAEILEFCKWIEQHNIQSYLEIGIWTGRLTNLLNRMFKFKMTAACDLGLAKLFDLEIKLPTSVAFFEGNSLSPIYSNWRNKIGHIDLTFIDSGHIYEEIVRDFEINQKFPHKYFAFHGIAGNARYGDGVKRFWEELKGDKTEIILPHAEINSQEATMGIGIWRAQDRPNAAFQDRN